MKRIDTPEHLDAHDAPMEDVEQSLRDLQWFNRVFGGVRIYRRLLRRMAPDTLQKLSVVDLGTGTSDLLESIDHPHLVPVGVDFKIAHLVFGRRWASRKAYRVAADALALPLRSGAADLVTSAHFFHHFSPEENLVILAEALRIARIGVIVNDTRRHLLVYGFVKLLAIFRIVGRITQYDAPASVLRGYTIAEARAIASRTSARRWEVVRMFPFRFGLLLWK